MIRNRSLFLIAKLALAAVGCGDASAPTTAPDRVLLCSEPPATDAESAVALYLTAWNEPDADERACQLQRSLSPDAVLIDANGTLIGRTSIIDHVDTEVLADLETRSARTIESPITFRHEEALARWVVTAANGNALETGDDWFEVGPGGRITRIHTFAGAGERVETSEELSSWERAWNVADSTERIAELSVATTDDVRFTDLLTDVAGREALSEEIERQRGALNGELALEDDVRVFAAERGQPTLIRQAAEIAIPDAGAIRVINYVRLRGGQIERLAGFPAQ